MTAEPDLTLFFGRFHPLLVHLPIGAIALLVFLEVLGRRPNHRAATVASGYVLAFAVPASIVSALLGWLLSQEGGYDAGLVRSHFWSGLATAFLCVVTALLYKLESKRPYRVCLVLTLVALAIASHLGGSLTHGRDYLAAYAPGPIRSLAGYDAGPQKTQDGPGADERPAFETVVLPILDRYCISCHGPEKAKGGLRLDSPAALMKADKGPAIVPGDPANSELLKRVRLPLDHDDHMPPDGKPQPTSDEIALVAWWIESGASSNAPSSRIRQSSEIHRILGSQTGSVTAPK